MNNNVVNKHQLLRAIGLNPVGFEAISAIAVGGNLDQHSYNAAAGGRPKLKDLLLGLADGTVAWGLDPRYDETGEILAAFMMKLALLGYAAQTIGIAKAAVGYAYRHATAVDYNPVETEIVRQGVAGLERHFTKPVDRKLAIEVQHIRKILELQGPMTGQHELTFLRNVSMVLVGFMATLRRQEVLKLDVCDVDMSSEEFTTVFIRFAKNDPEGRGKQSHIIASEAKQYDLKTWLLRYMRMGNVQRSPHCTKGRDKKAHCTACGRLFRQVLRPNAVAPPDRPLGANGTAVGINTVTEVVKELLTRVGVEDVKGYSAISLRRGSVSAGVATDARQEVLQAHGRWRGISGSDPYKDISVGQLLTYTQGLYAAMEVPGFVK